jgi:predicted transcriptional regulator
MQVKDIVKPAIIINESDTFEIALKAMMTQHTNTLLVVGEDGCLSGEVSVTDLLGAIVPDTLNGNEVISHFSTDDAFIASIQFVKDLPVSEFMSHDVTPLTLNDNLLTVVGTAIAQELARIPVIDDEGHPVGIISRQGLKQIMDKFMNVK